MRMEWMAGRCLARLAAAGLCALATAGASRAEGFAMPDSYVSGHFRDDPRVGTILTGAGAAVDPAAFDAALAAAKIVLIGETHTNPDHHLLQALILGRMVAAGRRPAVVFEMIPADVAPQLAAVLGAPGATADEVGAAAEWEARGWPAFAIYRPIVEAALAADLPILPGDLGRDVVRKIGREGMTALPPFEVARLGLDRAMPAEEATALSATLAQSHCGLLPERALAPMMLVQRARDGALAQAVMQGAATAGGDAVLIAGAGHVRADWGVPAAIRAKERDASVLAIGLMEAGGPDEEGPTAAAPLPYDYLLYTPREDISDPCEGIAEAMKGRPMTATGTVGQGLPAAK